MKSEILGFSRLWFAMTGSHPRALCNGFWFFRLSFVLNCCFLIYVVLFARLWLDLAVLCANMPLPRVPFLVL